MLNILSNLVCMYTYFRLYMIIIGISYASSSLPLLGAIAVASAIYFGWGYSGVQDFLWIKRIDPMTGLETSYNLLTRTFDHSMQLAANCTLKKSFVKVKI
jgi:hypothetical protein